MNKTFVFLLTFIFMFSFIIAEEHTGGIYSKQGAEYMDNGIVIDAFIENIAKIDENIYIAMTPYESSGKPLDNSTTICRFGVINPRSGNIFFLYQSNFTIVGNDDIWIGVIPGDYLNETGDYLYNWECEKSINGGYFNGILTITIDGEEQTLVKLIGYIFLILIMVSLIGLVKYNHDHTDFDKWDEEIKGKHKHMGQTFVRSIVYNLFKNTFLWYYFLGWLIILTLNNIVFGYLSSNAGQYFTLIANVYSLGFFLVTVFMIGHTWSYIRDTFETITEDNWGVGN